MQERLYAVIRRLARGKASRAPGEASAKALIPDDPTARARRSRPWWRWGLTGLSALGLALGGFLSWHYVTGGSMLGCSGGSPCDEVLNSQWSAIGGVLPVSGLAVGAYLAMLVCSLSIGPTTAGPVRRLAWDAMLLLSGAAAGSAVWFTIVQKWIIRAFCPYCMATHFTGLVLAVFVIWRASRQIDDDAAGVAPRTDDVVRENSAVFPRRATALRHAATWSLLGLALAGIVAAGQIGLAPSTAYRGGESQDKFAAIDSRAVPLVGSPDARYVVTLLFDYKCPHCQQLHLLLGEAIRRTDGKLAFALCPAPLSRQCNPYVPRDVDEFKDSCELAKIALAVWVADRAAFCAFDDWMYSFDSGDRWHPRTPDAARNKAIELLGRGKFDAARGDPWIDRYLQSSIRIYGATMQNGVGGVPKLVFGPHWVTAQPTTAADLVSILQTSLGVPAP
jgi:uncharacterized membrane protein